MNLSVRGLSVVLMVLQLLAPLIHAHKNETNLTTSFHLPEFEQINSLSKNDLAVFVSATTNDQVVTVSAGMKNNKRRFSLDNAIDFFLTLSFIILNITLACLVAVFSCLGLIRTRGFNLALPRAPPYLILFGK